MGLTTVVEIGESALNCGIATKTIIPSPLGSPTKQIEEERQFCMRNALFGSLKRLYVVTIILTGAAIANSVLVVYSCSFFSYHNTIHSDYTNSTNSHQDDDHSKTHQISSIHEDKSENGATAYSVEDFAFAFHDGQSDVGVGLFSYSVKHYSGSDNFQKDDICLRYPTDEHFDFFARKAPQHCSILAPTVASIAIAQVIFKWVFGCRLAGRGRILTIFLFILAGAIQFGTFGVMSATVIENEQLSSPPSSLCFSADSTTRCHLDSGAWYSLASALGYIILGLASAKLQTIETDRRENEDPDTTFCGGCRVNVIEKKKKVRPRLVCDTSSDSSSSDNSGTTTDKNDNRKGDLKSNSSGENHRQEEEHHNQEKTFQLASNLVQNNYHDSIIDRESEMIIRVDNRIQSRESEIIIRVNSGVMGRNKKKLDVAMDNLESGKLSPNTKGYLSNFDDDDHSIIKEVTSIETEFVRPDAGCCFCTEPVKRPKPNRKDVNSNMKKKKTLNTAEHRTIQHNKKWHDMVSMLSDDDERDVEVETEEREAERGDTIAEITSLAYQGTGTTVEECEASFLAEMETAQMEHTNWENSQWKKGFDFVRS